MKKFLFSVTLFLRGGVGLSERYSYQSSMFAQAAVEASRGQSGMIPYCFPWDCHTLCAQCSLPDVSGTPVTAQGDRHSCASGLDVGFTRFRLLSGDYGFKLPFFG